jgi:hypothetical protein
MIFPSVRGLQVIVGVITVVGTKVAAAELVITSRLGVMVGGELK